uniref:DNA-directed RNA polymerase n=1 Tax=Macrostomum lignano TaxID=282301 RepID=A0A1I8JS97_9PLAT
HLYALIITTPEGKQGRFRGHLLCASGHFTARHRYQPQILNLRMPIIAVGVPEFMARKLTYPSPGDQLQHRTASPTESATPTLALSTTSKLNDGRFPKRNAGIFRTRNFAQKLLNELRCGDTVERHLMDEDTVLLIGSNIATSSQHARVSVKPYRTAAPSTSAACTPFNADFDGDEMNLHVPQTEEARAAAKPAHAPQHPRNGEPLIAAIQDFITGAYLITCKDVFFNRDRAAQALFKAGRLRKSTCLLGCLRSCWVNFAQLTKSADCRNPPSYLTRSGHPDKPVEAVVAASRYSPAFCNPYPDKLASQTKAIYTDGEESATTKRLASVLVRSGVTARRLELKENHRLGQQGESGLLLLRDFGAMPAPRTDPPPTCRIAPSSMALATSTPAHDCSKQGRPGISLNTNGEETCSEQVVGGRDVARPMLSRDCATVRAGIAAEIAQQQGDKVGRVMEVLNSGANQAALHSEHSVCGKSTVVVSFDRVERARVLVGPLRIQSAKHSHHVGFDAACLLSTSRFKKAMSLSFAVMSSSVVPALNLVYWAGGGDSSSRDSSWNGRFFMVEMEFF